MPAQNLEIVRSIYVAMAAGEAPDAIHADAGYENPAYAVEPGTGLWADAVERLREIYPDFRLEPREFIDAGEHVVVIAEAHGRGASGVGVNQLLAHVWTMRDGKAAHFRWFKSREEALAAAGVEP